MAFNEYEAATAAGLDLWKWESSDYPRWFKAKVVAWYNLHNLVDAHTQDAATRELRRKK